LTPGGCWINAGKPAHAAGNSSAVKTSIFSLFFSLLIVVCPAERIVAQEKTIRIGFPSVAFQELPLFAANKRGFFRAEGLNVELVQIAGAPAIAALLSGDVDYVTHNSRIIATAVRGGGVKSVFNYVARPIYYLVTLPEIRQAKELHGRAVGVSSFGGAAYYITKRLLEFYGLNVSKDVAIRALGQDSIRFSALAARTIQGTLLPPDFAVRSKDIGFNVLVYAGDIVDMPMGGLGTTDKRLKEKRDEVRRVLRALLRSLRFVNDDRDGARALLIEGFKMPSAGATAAYDLGVKIFGRDGIPTDNGLKNLLAATREELKLQADIAPEAVMDLSIVRDAQRDLGLGKTP
jgi:ABC-type nitrate/sulfonate/bicarbonate transport system substrate-binding protein